MGMGEKNGVSKERLSLGYKRKCQRRKSGNGKNQRRVENEGRIEHRNKERESNRLTTSIVECFVWLAGAAGDPQAKHSAVDMPLARLTKPKQPPARWTTWALSASAPSRLGGGFKLHPAFGVLAFTRKFHRETGDKMKGLWRCVPCEWLMGAPVFPFASSQHRATWTQKTLATNMQPVQLMQVPSASYFSAPSPHRPFPPCDLCDGKLNRVPPVPDRHGDHLLCIRLACPCYSRHGN
jgi:hypothetical protein